MAVFTMRQAGKVGIRPHANQTWKVLGLARAWVGLRLEVFQIDDNTERYGRASGPNFATAAGNRRPAEVALRRCDFGSVQSRSTYPAPTGQQTAAKQCARRSSSPSKSQQSRQQWLATRLRAM